MAVSPAILQIAKPSHEIVVNARLRAAEFVMDGRMTPAAERHIARCWHYHKPTLTAIIFTRDVGHHSSGWWKNPDYERCYHLSLRGLAFDRGTPVSLPLNMDMARKWVECFFGEDAKLTWHEGPYTATGKAEDVHHYRLFCDQAWKPIIPRGEVYSKDWTPPDWKSFSEIHGTTPAEKEPAHD